MVARRDEDVQRMVRDDVLVHDPLDVGELLGRERRRVAEVEPELVGPDVGAGLGHVVAEPAAQGGVEQVGRGVVGHRRPAGLAVDPGAHPLALVKLAVLEPGDDHLVIVEPHDVLDGRAGRVGLDPAGVGHLAAALGVEGRLAQLHEHGPVVALVDRAHLGRHLEPLVADELRLEVGLEVRTSTRPPPIAALARSRCSSMSSAKPASSTRFPCSPATSTVSSIGNP